MLAALSRVKPTAMRLNLIERADGTLIIDDVYNANPVSMRCITDLADLAQRRRAVAIVGDMLELGEFALRLIEIGKLAAELGARSLIAVALWLSL